MMFREGQARSPTKSEWDSANVKPYKHTDPRPTKSGWDSAEKAVTVICCDRFFAAGRR